MALIIDTPPPLPPEFDTQPTDVFFNTPPDPNLLNLHTIPDLPYLPTDSQFTINTVGDLRSLLPPTWFPDDDNVLNAVLSTFAESLSSIQARNDWVYQQDRILTATGVWLDMFAEEFFGAGTIGTDETNSGWMYRRLGETDTPYRNRILFELMAQRNTRAGMEAMLTFWCGGVKPIIIEPWNPNDTGTFDTNTVFFDRQGYLGSNDDPFTTFIITHRAGGDPFQCLNDETPADFMVQIPGIIGTQVVSNTNYLYGGLDAGQLYFVDGDMNQSQVSDIDLYGVLNRTRPAGTKTFAKFLDSEQLPNNPLVTAVNLLDYNFILDNSQMSSNDTQTNSTGIAPHGYYNAFLDANFVLDQSMVSLNENDISRGILIPELLPGFLDIDFAADSNIAL